MALKYLTIQNGKYLITFFLNYSMPPKRKPTHVPPQISINYKKRGKVQQNKVTISETSHESNFVEIPLMLGFSRRKAATA